jgi:hypothetical protein
VFEDTQLYEVNKIGTMVFSMSEEHSVWEGGKEWNGMEWKKMNILRIFSHFLCLEV